MFKWDSSYSLVQACLSQEGQNVIHVDVLEQIVQTIHPEKSLSDENESSTFYENVFNCVRRLPCQTLWLLFLFEYKRVSLVWPMSNRDIVTRFLDFLKVGHHFPKMGLIRKSLLWILLLRFFSKSDCCFRAITKI